MKQDCPLLKPSADEGSAGSSDSDTREHIYFRASKVKGSKARRKTKSKMAAAQHAQDALASSRAGAEWGNPPGWSQSGLSPTALQEEQAEAQGAEAAGELSDWSQVPVGFPSFRFSL